MAKGDVKAMVISEYHPDSVLGASDTARPAIKGALEYARHERPDVIFVDDPSSNIRYPEIFAGECFFYNPVKNFMNRQFDVYQEFMENLRESSPDSEIHLTLTDASEYNLRRLTKRRVLRNRASAREKLKEKEAEIEDVNKQIRELEKEGGSKGELNRLYGKKGGLTRSLVDLEENLLRRMPTRESTQYREAREKTTSQYLDQLRKGAPSDIQIHLSEAETEINGNTFRYLQNSEKLSDTPIKHNFKHLLRDLNKKYIQGESPPDFVLTSAHNGFTTSTMYRHDEKDIYSLIASALTLEDQEMVEEIARGNFKGDILQGKQNRLEAVKRYSKSYPSPGVSMVGRRDGCFFVDAYPMDHLAKVGSGELNPEEIEYERIDFLADMHVGKGATDYESLENALKRIKDKKPNLLINVGETLQAQNYKTMPVETPRKTMRDLTKELEKYDDIKDLKEAWKREHQSENEPRIDNQIENVDYWMNDLVLEILTRTPYDVGYLIAEPTHVYKTGGEFGISEISILSRPFKNMEDGLKLLEKIDAIEIKDDSLLNLTDRLKGFNDDGCGWGKIEDLGIGDNKYTISIEHKPGSSTPRSDIPMRGIKRMQAMGDSCDLKFEGHLHCGFGTFFPRKENSIGLAAKGMTFNNYDSYGKKGGWPPATLGYMEVGIPKTRGAKGAYKLAYVTSEDLK